MNKKAEMNLVVAIPSIIIIGAIFYFGLQLFGSFYDTSSLAGTGLEIDQEGIDQLGEDISETSDIIFENYNFDNLINGILPYAVIGFAIIVFIIAIFVLTKP